MDLMDVFNLLEDEEAFAAELKWALSVEKAQQFIDAPNTYGKPPSEEMRKKWAEVATKGLQWMTEMARVRAESTARVAQSLQNLASLPGQRLEPDTYAKVEAYLRRHREILASAEADIRQMNRDKPP